MQSATSTQRKIKVEVANSPRPAGQGEGRSFARLLHQTLWCGLCQRFATKKKLQTCPPNVGNMHKRKRHLFCFYSLNCKSTFNSHKWEEGRGGGGKANVPRC